MRKYYKYVVTYIVVLIIGTIALSTNDEKPVSLMTAFLQAIPTSLLIVIMGFLIYQNRNNIKKNFNKGKTAAKHANDNYQEYKTTEEYKIKKEKREKALSEFETKATAKAEIKYQNSKKGKQENIRLLKAAAERNGLAYCPKCGSTSITTTNKKVSLAKGAVGAAVGSMLNPVGTAVGAGAGALSSKKMYCVCMKCGNRWKL